MSLKVWLPLNGNLENKGLDNITFSKNTGATVATDGKLGSCYSFDATDDWIQYNIDKTKYANKPISYALWFKCSGANNGGTILCLAADLTMDYSYSSSNGIKFSYWRCYSNNGTRTGDTGMTPNYYDASTWHHIAIVFDAGANQIYVDGILALSDDKSSKYTSYWAPLLGSSYNKLSIGKSSGSTSWTGGKVNDVRIYDHALSAKEVKEISQGLVLHYKLDNNGLGNDNILVNTYFDQRYIQSTGWNVTKNGTDLASSWGGYNSGVANQDTVYHAHLKKISDEWVYEFIKTADEVWLGIWQGGLQNKLTAGQTYTFSWEEYHISGTNRVGTGLYYFKPGASSAGFHLGIQSDSNITRVFNKWQKYSYTFIAPDDADWSRNMMWYIYGHYNNNGIFYMRRPKLELGNLATPWSPNPNDSLYQISGLNNSIIYDSSGYNNNGTPNEVFTVTNDSARYNISLCFNGTTNCIIVPYNTVCPDNIFTVNLWFKKDSIGTKNYETLFGGPSGFEMDTRSSSATTLMLNMVSTRGGKRNLVTELTFGIWYMVTMVRDGTKERYYINGIFQSEIDAKPMPTGTYRIGAWNSNTGQNYYGQISDFRLYNTPLSADDILELYNTSASVDKNGNIYARELVEL